MGSDVILFFSYFLFSKIRNLENLEKKSFQKKTTFKNLNAVLLVVKNVPDLSFLGHLGYWVNVNFLEDFFRADPLL